MAAAPGPSRPAPAPAAPTPTVLLGVTGGIACYKVATVVSRLVQANVAVRVLMTEAATRFVTPLTFQSLSGQAVVTSVWQASNHPESPHIGLARSCRLMLIAPASADCLARLAAGLCDDIVTLSACALPAGVPLLIAPAMNADMWANPIVQRNIATLRDLLKATIIGPEEGWQACRTAGAGRMSEPETIVAAVETALARSPQAS